MPQAVSKSKFKPHSLEYFRKIEQTGEELIITDHGRPVLKVDTCLSLGAALVTKDGCAVSPPQNGLVRLHFSCILRRNRGRKRE